MTAGASITPYKLARRELRLVWIDPVMGTAYGDRDGS
jgi:hypothetical protein